MLIKLRYFPLFVLAFALAGSPALAQDKPIKIALANPSRIFTEMQETHDLQAKLQDDGKNLENTEREKRERIKALQDARDQLKPDSPQYQDRNEELMKAAIEFEAWGKIASAEAQRQQKVQMKALFDKIEAAVQEIAAQKGFDLVIAEQHPDFPPSLDKVNIDQLRGLINERNVLFVSPKLDISADVIALLDSRYKAGGDKK